MSVLHAHALKTLFFYSFSNTTTPCCAMVLSPLHTEGCCELLSDMRPCTLNCILLTLHTHLSSRTRQRPCVRNTVYFPEEFRCKSGMVACTPGGAGYHFEGERTTYRIECLDPRYVLQDDVSLYRYPIIKWMKTTGNTVAICAAMTWSNHAT